MRPVIADPAPPAVVRFAAPARVHVVELCAVIHQELHEIIRSPASRSVQGGFAAGVHLVEAQARFESDLQRFERLGFRSAGELIAIIDAGSDHQDRASVLQSQFGVGTFFEQQPHHCRVSGERGANERRGSLT